VSAAKKSKLRIIGWREWISLPDFGLPAIKVKVDSGARTSALHATKIKYIEDSSGQTWVTFTINTGARGDKPQRVKAPLLEQRMVKSSLGHATLRPVIVTKIQLGELTWSTEITLVNRDPMGFRMLLGRRAVKGRYLIHPSRSFIQSKSTGASE
jgi:hypothetical protein